jgi:hypothetical protein
VTPAESATNGATVSLGRPYPGLEMKTNSLPPASGGETEFEVFTDEQDAVDSFFPDRAARHYDILEWIQEQEKRPAPDLQK